MYINVDLVSYSAHIYAILVNYISTIYFIFIKHLSGAFMHLTNSILIIHTLELRLQGPLISISFHIFY